MNSKEHEASVKCSNVNLKEELSEQAAAEFLTKRMNLPARREEETGWKNAVLILHRHRQLCLISEKRRNR